MEVPVIGEVILNNHDFYSYEAKYLDEKGVELIAPADISEEWVVKIQETSKKAYNALYCSGMARVDSFFLLPPVPCRIGKTRSIFWERIKSSMNILGASGLI